ncbi:MAG: hypothetical protein NVS2B7_28260 [Herpetosiphon sp.]
MTMLAYTIGLLGDDGSTCVYEARQWSLLVTDAAGREQFIDDCMKLSEQARQQGKRLWLVIDLGNLNPAQAMRLEPQFAMALRSIPMTLRLYGPTGQWPITNALTRVLGVAVDGVLHRSRTAALPDDFPVVTETPIFRWPRDDANS